MTTAASEKLLPIGGGRHRTLTEPECAVLAHLLAGPDRFRVTLAAMAALDPLELADAIRLHRDATIAGTSR